MKIERKKILLLEFPMGGECLPLRNSLDPIFPLHWLKLWALKESTIQLCSTLYLSLERRKI